MRTVETASRTGFRRLGRGRRWITLLGIAVLFALTFHRFLFLGNFAVVEPGRVYRSAQPGRGLEGLLRQQRIASILNLRGGSPQDWWYANEVATTKRLQVDLYDLPLSAERRPSRSELIRMIDLFGRCRYPLLIHCKSGSDRTALAVALYRLVVNRAEPRDAIGAFSLWRGHVAAFGPERLHEPIDEYAAWLRQQARAHSPERFREWVLHQYDAPDTSAPVEPLRPGPRAELAEGGPTPARP